MKKFFMAAILIFGIVAGQFLQASAKSNVTWHMEYKCQYCNKVVSYDGPNENYKPGDHSQGVCNSPEGQAAQKQFGNIESAPISFKEGHLWDLLLMKNYFELTGKWHTLFQVNIPDRAVREAEWKKRQEEYSQKQLAKKEILKKYVQVLKTSSQNAANYESQANAKFKAKDYIAAKQFWVNAMEVNPYESSYNYELAKCYMKDKDKDYDLIINQINTAIDKQVYRMESLTGVATHERPGSNIIEDKLKMAEYWDYLSSIYNRMAMNNFFKSINKLTNYSQISQNCKIVSEAYKNSTNPNMPMQSLPGLTMGGHFTGPYSNLATLRKQVFQGSLQNQQRRQQVVRQPQQKNPIAGILGGILGKK